LQCVIDAALEKKAKKFTKQKPPLSQSWVVVAFCVGMAVGSDPHFTIARV